MSNDRSPFYTPRRPALHKKSRLGSLDTVDMPASNAEYTTSRTNPVSTTTCIPSGYHHITLTRYVDITFVPKRSFIAVLRNFTSDDREREKMDEFITTKAGAEDLYEYTSKVRRTIVEVLEEFRNVKIPLTYVFDVFPAPRPREFSMASSVAVRFGALAHANNPDRLPAASAKASDMHSHCELSYQTTTAKAGHRDYVYV
ncbi:unnamed protein product [Peniophora sp. CBMAI 1063]|nr:unnamed protein product [Peniophora sp. CBMAI 1063]